MTREALPLADLAIAIQSITAAPDLVLTGIDLDSGQSIKIQITADQLRKFTRKPFAPLAGLVLVLKLYAEIPAQVAWSQRETIK